MYYIIIYITQYHSRSSVYLTSSSFFNAPRTVPAIASPSAPCVHLWPPTGGSSHHAPLQLPPGPSSGVYAPNILGGSRLLPFHLPNESHSIIFSDCSVSNSTSLNK